MADNMRFYALAQNTPEEAKKPIQAGRLKGMTDINPMFRIKRLTEIFGPCGLGWWYDITDKRVVDDEITGQRAAFVDINLFYKDPETGEESHAIPGTGGSAFVAKERNGPYMSDECFKMALTDAISVSAKALGVAADVYWAKDRTKYSAGESAQPGDNQPGERCVRCGEPINGVATKNGRILTAPEIVEMTRKAYGAAYCYKCSAALKAAKASAEGQDGGGN